MKNLGHIICVSHLDEFHICILQTTTCALPRIRLGIHETRPTAFKTTAHIHTLVGLYPFCIMQPARRRCYFPGQVMMVPMRSHYETAKTNIFSFHHHPLEFVGNRESLAVSPILFAQVYSRSPWLLEEHSVQLERYRREAGIECGCAQGTATSKIIPIIFKSVFLLPMISSLRSITNISVSSAGKPAKLIENSCHAAHSV